jgi:hypothetical protein
MHILGRGSENNASTEDIMRRPDLGMDGIAVAGSFLGVKPQSKSV